MDFKYEALNLLKTLFTKQVFKDAKLQDGTIVSAEAFEPGQELMIIDEAGNKTPAPDGEHILEDGTCVYVTGGKIDRLEKLETEDGIEEEVTIEELAIDTADIAPLVEEVPEAEDEIAMLRTMCEEMMNKIGVMEEEMSKMKMSKQETDEVFKNGIIELSDNFSKIPGSEKTTITPAGEFESKFNKVSKVGKKDSIIDWISKNNKS
jgi:hypothetical protein